MVTLPIPDKGSAIRYRDLTWRGRNLGEIVAKLTRGKQRSDYGAHLDPDLRRDACPRGEGWRPAFGQRGSAQGHLRKQGVGVGALFLFWGLFRRVDDEMRWQSHPEHRIWGWLQVGTVASVDEIVRRGGGQWRWAMEHPHFAFPTDRTNTLYVASERLSMPGVGTTAIPGSGVFDRVDDSRRLTCLQATRASQWSLPAGFLPRGRPPLSYHPALDCWGQAGDRTLLRTVARGQEFVLDLDYYPELTEWAVGLIAENRG
jgi:hypothetical protein